MERLNLKFPATLNSGRILSQAGRSRHPELDSGSMPETAGKTLPAATALDLRLRRDEKSKTLPFIGINSNIIEKVHQPLA
ncbi:hypothetical protein [Nitratifractor sp.]